MTQLSDTSTYTVTPCDTIYQHYVHPLLVTPHDTLCQHYVHPPTVSDPDNPRYQTCQICNRVVCKPYCSHLLKTDVYSRNRLRIVTKTLHTNNAHQKYIAFKDITSKVYRITSVSKCCNCPMSHLTLPDSTEG